MNVIKAPKYLGSYIAEPWLFAAGSIEMGAAEDWQTRLAADLKFAPGTILNPRRDDWDSSWEQSISNHKFREQVQWELSALEQSDIIGVYFAPETKSPISLLELGLFKHKKPVVFCPDGFWRKGNVDIVCRRYEIPQYDNWDAWITRLYSEVYAMAKP